MRQADSTATRMGPLGLMIEVLGDPRTAFQILLQGPIQWKIIAIPLLLFAGVSSLDLLQQTGGEFWTSTDRVPDWFANDWEGYRAYARFAGVVSLLLGTVLAFTFTSFLIWGAASRVVDAGVSLKAAMAIVALSSIIPSLGALATLLLKLATGNDEIRFSIGSLLTTADHQGLVAFFIYTLDLFEVWYLFILSLGLSCLSRTRLRSSFLICSLLWIVPRLLAF